MYLKVDNKNFIVGPEENLNGAIKVTKKQRTRKQRNLRIMRMIVIEHKDCLESNKFFMKFVKHSLAASFWPRWQSCLGLNNKILSENK